MLSKAYEILKRPGFQDSGPGQSQFPAYIYVYPADCEFEFRQM